MDKPRSASVPHIRFEYPRKPFPHFALSTRIMQCGWRRSGKFTSWFGLLLFSAILVPYTIALSRGHVRPLLPLISKAGGIPPESGIFSFALYLTALVGTLTTAVRYVYVSSQNEAKDDRIMILNKIGFGAGLVSFFGMIVVASYPVNLWSDKEEWKEMVLYPHMFGAFCLFFFGAIYLLFQTAISVFFSEGRRGVVIVRCILFLLCAVCFGTSSMNHLSSMDSLRPKGILLQADEEVSSMEYSETYLISSICEWIMVFLFVVYFFTFFRESERVSVSVTFRTLISGRRISLESLGNLSKI